jgi:hypothetical protein
MVEASQHSLTDRATPAVTPVKVLFLAGKGRSGGSLLANLLGQLPGFFNVGELNRLWDGGLVNNYSCGCGAPVRECPTWQAILNEADALLGDSPLVPLADARIDRDQAAVVRWPKLVRLLRARVDRRDRWRALDRYTTASAAVYRAITVVTGARVIVDSSRLPTEPIALGLVPDVDVRLGHVVRDPRAVVYSWKRKKAWTDRDTGEHMPRFGATFTTVSWLARNLVVEILCRRHPSTIVQYDDLARDPGSAIRRLADLIGEPAGDLEFLTSDTATVVPTHSVGGNPDRMSSGAVVIKSDDEWRHALSGRDRTVATALAFPLLRRYGFPVRVEPGSHASPYPNAPGGAA